MVAAQGSSGGQPALSPTLASHSLPMPEGFVLGALLLPSNTIFPRGFVLSRLQLPLLSSLTDATHQAGTPNPEPSSFPWHMGHLFLDTPE